MSEVFFTSDTHFGHSKILTFDRPRPFKTIEEHDQALIDNWNSVVTNKDTVYHLGDFALEEGKKRARLIMAQLNFRKLVIVLGNHDNLRWFTTAPTMYTSDPQVEYYGAFELRKHNFILTHIPVHASQMSRFGKNLHGHLHHNVVTFTELDETACPLWESEDKNYYNVGVDHHNYTPVHIDEVLKDV